MAAAAFTIRPMAEADRPALLEHAAALNAHEQPFCGDRNLGPAGAAESLDHVLGRVAATGGATWVAEMEGRVVGHLCLMLDSLPPFVAAGQRLVGYISDAYLRPEARGSGAFQAMLEAAERHAAARGATRIMLGFIAGNAMAERAYLKAGFRPYAVELVKDLPPGA